MSGASRFGTIDVLRFIAAYSVCIAHFLESQTINAIVSPFVLGKTSVVIFFIISGYLIPLSLNKKNGGLIGFWVSRVFRLYPMYWVSILLAVIFLKKHDVTQILFNLTMFQSVFKVPDVIGVFWTLIIEMFFYIFCSVAYALNILSKRQFAVLSMIMFTSVAFVLAVIRYSTGKNIPIGIPLLMSMMILGYVLRLYERGVTKRSDVLLSLAVFAVFLPFTSFLGYSVKGGFTGEPISYVISYIAGVTIFFTFYIAKPCNRIAARLGEISYSSYLVHPVIIYVLHDFFSDFRFGNIVAILLLLIVVAIVSEICYRTIELPAINFGKKVKMSFLNSRPVPVE